MSWMDKSVMSSVRNFQQGSQVWHGIQNTQQATDLELSDKLQSTGTVVGRDVILGKAEHGLFVCLNVIREVFRIVLQHLSRYEYVYM